MTDRLLRTLLMSLLLLGMGCGAYFNTYYNAREAYDEGVRTQERSGDRAARTSFDKCLRVSSKLLQFYPESRWVDNTILLIGQCYVHMEQYHRALRKFDELEARFPDSELMPDVRIWRARSLLALERDEACRAELGRLKGLKLNREQRVELNKVWATLHQSEEDLDRLVETQQKLLEIARKKSDKTRINLEIAHSYEALGEWELALKHFGNARRHRPNHELLLESWLGSLDNMLRLGRLQTVERRLKKLKKDERFFDERHALLLREAWLFEAKGQVTQAEEAWRGILLEHKSTTSSSASAYGLARRFLIQKAEPDSAEVYYKRSKQEKSTSIWADSSASALDLLGNLRSTQNSARDLDLAMQYLLNGLNPDTARVRMAAARLENLRPGLLDSLNAAFDSALALNPLPEADSTAKPDALPEIATEPQTSEDEPAAKGKSRRRKLFDFDRKEREEARQDSLEAAQRADSLASVAAARLQAERDSVWTLAILDTLTTPVIDSLTIMQESDSLARLLVEERFTYAELLARKLRRLDQADSLYSLLLADSTTGDEQMARLWYAYGRMKIVQQRDTSGYDWMRDLVERYPLALASNPARAMLGLPPAVTAEDSAAVLLDRAQTLRFEGTVQLGEVLAAYRACTERYPETQAAYTAWIAMGVLALEDLENPAMAEESFRQALRRFPDGEANTQLLRRLGIAVLEEEAAEVDIPVQEIEVSVEQRDESGRFTDQDLQLDIEERLDKLRQRFESIGRISLERVLE